MWGGGKLVSSLHRLVNFSICMLGLRTTFIMKDNGIKILFCCTFEMDKISCKLVDWNFEPHDVRNMIKL